MNETATTVLQVVLTISMLAGLLFVLHRRLQAYYASRPHLKFRRQIIELSAAIIAILAAILLLPLSGELRSDLLGLFGLVVTAIIALSSTTLVGNIMAGIMLRTIGSCKLGDYITVGDHFGRISEMDLLHTEIQTEQRDLTTLPNLYLVTHPVRVMHTSGSVLSVDLSLGYDVSRHEVEKLLVEAAKATGLESPYVQIRELGDFSVTYAVSGLLTEVNHLLAKRRELRARTVDALHGANIEIVSPSFMNTRVYDADTAFIPEDRGSRDKAPPEATPDAIVFDKAEKAENVEKLREKLAGLEQRLADLDVMAANTGKDEVKDAIAREQASVRETIERTRALIDKREAKISEI